MRVQVSYMVPVEVVIDLSDDLRTGNVARVVVIDEDVKLSRDATGHPQIHDDSYGEVTSLDVRKAALETAESADAMWPAWEFGF